MNTILKNYESHIHAELKFKKSIKPAVDRYLSFIQECDLHNIVDYHFLDIHAVEFSEYVVKPSKTTDNLYFENHQQDPQGEYFSVPLDFLSSPESWEDNVRRHLEDNFQRAITAVVSIFGSAAKAKTFSVRSYPNKIGDQRFLKVKILRGQKIASHPDLKKITDAAHHPGFILDKETGLLYSNSWVLGGKSLTKLIRADPNIAESQYLFRIQEYRAITNRQ